MTDLIVAVAGGMGSGKDTVGDYLCRVHGFDRLSFATPLKEALRTMFPQLTDRDLYGPSEAREKVLLERQDGKRVTVRYALQTLGTEWGRVHIHHDIWPMLALEQAKRSPGPVVITDARFNNEFNLVREAGGHLWHLTRPGHEKTSDHPSERDMYGEHLPKVATAAITNDGGFDLLYDRIDAIMETISE